MTTQAAPELIPDRVSLEKDSPFYVEHWPKIGVKFDGRERDDVQEYCIIEGWIKRFVRNSRGEFMKERGKNRVLKQHGTVEAYLR
jgi:hypothetical protein